MVRLQIFESFRIFTDFASVKIHTVFLEGNFCQSRDSSLRDCRNIRLRLSEIWIGTFRTPWLKPQRRIIPIQGTYRLANLVALSFVSR